MSVYEYRKITLAAGIGEALNISGKFLRLLSTTGVVKIGFNGDEAYELPAAVGVYAPDGFSQIRFVNPGTGSITIELAVGGAEITDDRLNVSGTIGVSSIATPVDLSKAATLTPTADITLAAAAATLIKAINLNRREIMITALAANGGAVRIAGATVAANIGLEIAPGQTVTLDTTAAIYGFSALATDKVAIVEISE